MRSTDKSTAAAEIRLGLEIFFFFAGVVWMELLEEVLEIVSFFISAAETKPAKPTMQRQSTIFNA